MHQLRGRCLLHQLLPRLLTPLALAPAVCAVWVGAGRLRDNWHHPSDVVTGLLLGGSCAALAFSGYFGAPFGAPFGASATLHTTGYRALPSLPALPLPPSLPTVKSHVLGKNEEGDCAVGDCYCAMP